MTQSQFKYISELSWEWYRGNMKSWAIEMLRNLQNAPQWVKDCLASDLIVCPSMDEKVFELAHNEDIEKILRASQKRNFEVNYTKELTEFFEAKRDGNEYEMIDALCDMVIVAMNAGAILGDEHSDWFYNNLTNPIKYSQPYVLGLLYEIRQKGYDPYLCLLETIKELRTRTGAWNEKEGKWCKHDGAYTFDEAKILILKKHGTEALAYSKLSSEDENYWVFDMELIEEHYVELEIKKWYKADYEKCKKGGENA